MTVVATEQVQTGAVTFADVVREHQSMVFSLAYHLLHDRALAEEVAQDVFLQLYRNFGEVRTDDHIRHWLRRVAPHRSIDQARRRKVRPQVALEDAPPLVARHSQHDPMLRRLLRRLVGSLPERSRAIVVLRYQEDLDPVEIAEILDVPVKTVRSRLHRSLAILREKLSRSQGEVRS